ncbi:MAG: 50S ribosomal protein L36 [Armatimonadetes bacterium]|nr:50S ribosomal protein L36 [Armatimonadota bacterium]
MSDESASFSPKRGRRVFVICENPKHKQRQG